MVCKPQHSDLDWDQYIAFQSPLSSDSNRTSLLKHPESRLGLYSPQPASAELVGSVPGIEIPDSQPKIASACDGPHLTGASHSSKASLSPSSRHCGTISQDSLLSTDSRERPGCFVSYKEAKPASLGLLNPPQVEIPDSFPQEEGLQAALVLDIDSELVRETQVHICSQDIVRTSDTPGILPSSGRIHDSVTRIPANTDSRE